MPRLVIVVKTCRWLPATDSAELVLLYALIVEVSRGTLTSALVPTFVSTAFRIRPVSLLGTLDGWCWIRLVEMLLVMFLAESLRLVFATALGYLAKFHG